MTEKGVRRLYEPPQARDLSAFSVSGQVGPLGMCLPGPRPYYNCVEGGHFIGPCSPGTLPDTSSCVEGAFHTYPTCHGGSVASTTCISGANQQW